MTESPHVHPNPLRGIANLSGGEILARAVAFVGTVMLTRRLGSESFGVVGFATALVGYLALGVNVGLADVGAREVARHPDRARAVFLSVVGMRLALAAAAAVILTLLVAFLPKPPEVRLVVLLAGLSFVSLALDPLWVYRALERTATAAAGQVLAQCLYVLAVLWLISGPADVARVPLAQAGAEIAAAICFAVPLVGWGWSAGEWKLGTRLLREAGFITTARLMRALIISFDVVFLGFTAATSQVGLYTASYRLCFLLMAIAGAIRVAFLPSFARAERVGADALERILGESLQVSLLVGAPVVVGGMITARPLLGLLFGRPFEPAAPALALLLLAMGFFFVGVVLINVFLVTHQTALQAKVYAIACALNVGLNLWAIPRYGIVGAATTTALAEGAIAVAGIVAIRRVLGVTPRLAPLCVPVGMALVMGAVVWAAKGRVGLAGQLAVGACCYGVMVIAWLRLRPTRFPRWR